jgi:Fic family protein
VVQAAIVHAQFELIHPFKDGNGRIGRLLISLFLFQAKVLSQPMFYLSAYLEDHREEYYEYLRRVSAEEDWDAWIIFFLRAVTEQAKINSTKVRVIRQLYEEMKRRVEDITHSPYALRILDGIFARPIFSTTVFFEEIEVSRTTGLPLLRKLKEANILTPVRAASGRRPEMLAFSQLLNIAEGKTVL